MGGGGAAAGWIDGWMPRSRVAGRNAGGGFFLPWVGVRVWVLGGGEFWAAVGVGCVGDPLLLRGFAVDLLVCEVCSFHVCSDRDVLDGIIAWSNMVNW